MHTTLYITQRSVVAVSARRTRRVGGPGGSLPFAFRRYGGARCALRLRESQCGVLLAHDARSARDVNHKVLNIAIA